MSHFTYCLRETKANAHILLTVLGGAIEVRESSRNEILSQYICNCIITAAEATLF